MIVCWYIHKFSANILHSGDQQMLQKAIPKLFSKLVEQLLHSQIVISALKGSICLKFLLVHISLILYGEYEGWEGIFGKKGAKPIMPSVSFLFFCKESKNTTHFLVRHFLQKLQWYTILSIYEVKHHSEPHQRS